MKTLRGKWAVTFLAGVLATAYATSAMADPVLPGQFSQGPGSGFTWTATESLPGGFDAFAVVMDVGQSTTFAPATLTAPGWSVAYQGYIVTDGVADYTISNFAVMEGPSTTTLPVTITFNGAVPTGPLTFNWLAYSGAETSAEAVVDAWHIVIANGSVTATPIVGDYNGVVGNGSIPTVDALHEADAPTKSVPIPATMWTGLVLLAGFGLFEFARKRRRQIV